jgi:hypothetical protein
MLRINEVNEEVTLKRIEFDCQKASHSTGINQISWHELILAEKIGVGAFAEVFKGSNLHTNSNHSQRLGMAAKWQ